MLDSVSARPMITTRYRAGFSRFLRYSAASLIAFALAQLGLAFGYGILGWGVPASVVLSLAVSIGPAYLLNRRYVWPRPADGTSPVAEINGFIAIAVAGTATTIGVAGLAEAIGRHYTDSHLTLTAVVNGASVVATIVVWIARYLVLDRVVFRVRDDRPPQ